jgi:5-methylcytosine-specific restriction enzyme subunit McrC
MDTKWKLLNQSAGDSRTKYGLSQADFYQMFAYGHKYLQGTGKLVLIYPRHSGFLDALPTFSLGTELDLFALPYDLETDELLTPCNFDLPFLASQHPGSKAA